MIRFNREEKKVQVKIEHGIFGDKSYFTLELEQGQEYQAELLKRAFQENLNRHQKQMKEKYYNKGWSDAKAKRKKRTYDKFWGGWF